MQGGERLDRGVETRVVAERTLRTAFPRLQPALEHHLGVRRHLQRDGQAVDHLHPLAAQEPGEQVLVDLRRQRGGRRVGHRRVTAERDRHRQPLPAALGDGMMGVGVLVDLPVHADRPGVMALQPVHAKIALTRLGMLRVGQAQVQEHPAVVRPGVHAGQAEQVDVRALEDDVLARRGPDPARRHRPQRGDLAQRLPQPAEPDRDLGSEQGGDPVADLVEAAGPQRGGHPPLGAEDVDGQRHVGAERPVEQQRGPALPNHPRDDLGDLQDRVDRDADVPQVAVALEMNEERAQIRPGHDTHPGRTPILAAARGPGPSGLVRPPAGTRCRPVA